MKEQQAPAGVAAHLRKPLRRMTPVLSEVEGLR